MDEKEKAVRSYLGGLGMQKFLQLFKRDRKFLQQILDPPIHLQADMLTLIARWAINGPPKNKIRRRTMNPAKPKT